MARCSMCLVTREMEMKNSMRYHFMLTRIAIVMTMVMMTKEQVWVGLSKNRNSHTLLWEWKKI